MIACSISLEMNDNKNNIKFNAVQWCRINQCVKMRHCIHIHTSTVAVTLLTPQRKINNDIPSKKNDTQKLDSYTHILTHQVKCD